MSEAPSWLTQENVSAVAENPAAQKAAVSAAKNPAVQSAMMGAATQAVVGSNRDIESGPTDFDASESEIADIRKHHLFLRIVNICCALMMGVAAFTSLNSDVATAFICGYVFFFGLLICCFEVGLQAVSKCIVANFGFMYTLTGRFLMIVVVLGLLVRLNIWGQITMALVCFSLLAQMYVLFKFPKFEEYLVKKHYYQEKNFE